MKHYVQILLLLAFIGPAFAAAEQKETMEERKKRIARKYLRERVDITYSEEVVPDDRSEAEDALAADGLDEPDMTFERQEPGMAMAPPPMRTPPPRRANSNWLLSETTDPQDSYDDPYMQKEDEPEQNDWTGWGTGSDDASFFSTEPDTRFSPRDDSALRDPSDRSSTFRQDRAYNPRNPYRQQAPNGYQPPGGQRGSSAMVDPSRQNSFNSELNPYRQDTFPRQPGTRTYPQFDADRQRSGGSSYGNPYSTQQELPSQREPSARRSGYAPYRSPYQTPYAQRREQQGEQRGSTGPSEEYHRQDAFEQWKRYQPRRFDPTGDDAFVDEMMPGR